jgi:hypothetical protein
MPRPPSAIVAVIWWERLCVLPRSSIVLRLTRLPLTSTVPDHRPERFPLFSPGRMAERGQAPNERRPDEVGAPDDQDPHDATRRLSRGARSFANRSGPMRFGDEPGPMRTRVGEMLPLWPARR